MLSILIQLNPGYLLGIMEKDSLALQRGAQPGSKQDWEPPAKLIVGTSQKTSRKEYQGNVGCLGGISVT